MFRCHEPAACRQLSSAAGSITNQVRQGDPSPDMLTTVSGHAKGRSGTQGFFVYRLRQMDTRVHCLVCDGLEITGFYHTILKFLTLVRVCEN